jgi:hypothetical protein
MTIVTACVPPAILTVVTIVVGGSVTVVVEVRVITLSDAATKTSPRTTSEKTSSGKNVFLSKNYIALSHQ